MRTNLAETMPRDVLDAVYAMTLDGVPATEICKKLGITEGRVTYLRRKLQVRAPSQTERQFDLIPKGVWALPHTAKWFIENDRSFRKAMKKAMTTEPREWPRDLTFKPDPVKVFVPGLRTI